MKLPIHPAVFSDSFIPVIYDFVKDEPVVFDMFAGTGKIADIINYGYSGKIVTNEIETSWYRYSVNRNNKYGDKVLSLNNDYLMYSINRGTVPCFATSPTYGNRLADSYNPKDDSYRLSYKFCLNSDLKTGNSAAMQWGDYYKKFHFLSWVKAYTELVDGGVFVLNISDHIRNKKVIRVSWWHLMTCINIGFSLDKIQKVYTRRFKMGSNNNLRVPYELVIRFIKNPQ